MSHKETEGVGVCVFSFGSALGAFTWCFSPGASAPTVHGTSPRWGTFEFSKCVFSRDRLLPVFRKVVLTAASGLVRCLRVTGNCHHHSISVLGSSYQFPKTPFTKAAEPEGCFGVQGSGEGPCPPGKLLTPLDQGWREVLGGGEFRMISESVRQILLFSPVLLCGWAGAPL